MAFKMKGFKPFTKGTPYKAVDTTLIQGAKDSVNKDAVKATAAAKGISDTSKGLTEVATSTMDKKNSSAMDEKDSSAMAKKNSYKNLEADLDDYNLKKKRKLNYKPQSAMKKKKEYEPQTKTRGYKGGEHTDSTPQVQMQKKKIGALEGEIEGIFDNEYMEAKNRGDKSEVKRYQKQMLKLKKEIEHKGGKYTHVDMSSF